MAARKKTDKTENVKKTAGTGMLVALRPILYEGRQFNKGDSLPLYDKAIVDAWVQNGSAKWTTAGGEEEKPETKICDVANQDPETVDRENVNPEEKENGEE